jgi:hypothetical protein
MENMMNRIQKFGGETFSGIEIHVGMRLLKQFLKLELHQG